MQVCWDHGSGVFPRCMALCLAYDSGKNCHSNLIQSRSLVEWLSCIILTSVPEITLLCESQNDLVHGWGLDFALRKCVEVRDTSSSFEFFVHLHALLWLQLYILDLKYNVTFLKQPAHEKIGVVDSQWIVHQTVPSLGNQVETCFLLVLYHTIVYGNEIFSNPFWFFQGESRDGKAPWQGVCKLQSLFSLFFRLYWLYMSFLQRKKKKNYMCLLFTPN